MAPLRRAVVASQFYEGSAEALRAQLKGCFLSKLGPQKLPTVNMSTHPRSIVGLISPHAGYLYSGAVAASAFYALALDGKPDTAVILGPNHTGNGSALSVMREGTWQTPLGKIEIDTALADGIISECGILDVDELAHRYEHSIEVQLPFLQFLYGDKIKIVPICYQMQDYESAVEIGRALTEALDATNSVVIASSDMTHYEPAKVAAEKDRAALDAALKVDAKAFYETVERENVSACGYAPITSLITYANGVNAKAELLGYHNSGDVSGKYSSVVGYAAACYRRHV